jgi:hypothetical protein
MIAKKTTVSWAASNGALATVIVARTNKGSYTTILHHWITRAAKEQEIPQWHNTCAHAGTEQPCH